MKGLETFLGVPEKDDEKDPVQSDQDLKTSLSIDMRFYIVDRVHGVSFALEESLGKRRLTVRFRPRRKRDKVIGEAVGGCSRV